MATFHFPLGSHLGKLIWAEHEKIFSPKEFENIFHILYYMGYNASFCYNEKGIDFNLLKPVDLNHDAFRNILFDFIMLFYPLNINMPNIEYAESFLQKHFIPLEKNNQVAKMKFIHYNENFYLTFTEGYMVSGVGFRFLHPIIYRNHYIEGDEILPIISMDNIQHTLLRFKMDMDLESYANQHFTYDIEDAS